MAKSTVLAFSLLALWSQCSSQPVYTIGGSIPTHDGMGYVINDDGSKPADDTEEMASEERQLMCDNLQRQLELANEDPVITGLFIFINGPVVNAGNLLGEAFEMLRMGGDVEKYIEMFDDVYKQIETDVEESCGLTVPEGISKNVATFEDGVRRLLGVETPEMEEKSGFPINIGRVGNKKPHRK